MTFVADPNYYIVPMDGADLRTEDMPDSYELLFRALWHNGAEIQVGYHTKALSGEDPSDRIHLWIATGEGARRGFILNIEDAIDIITGLSKAIRMAVLDEIPTKPQE